MPLDENDVYDDTKDVIKRLHSSLKKVPENIVTESPDGLNVDLMMHQKHGLTWMLWRETQQPRGGILADDMGLGKTLSMISLILEQKNRRKASDEANETLKTEMKAHFRNDPDVIPAFATLVIAPASVIYQWEKEIENRVPNSLSVYVYYGPKRIKNVQNLMNCDVVITTIETIAKELVTEKCEDETVVDNKKKTYKKVIAENIISPLTKIGWERIILDEAHKIKNHKTQNAKSCFRLPAFSRWALTGTPIHNNLWDLFSLIRFIRLDPFGEENIWKHFIINSDERNNQERLNIIVNGLLLRRKKNDTCSVTQRPLVALPQRKYEIVEIKLDGFEEMCYEQMFKACRQQVKMYIAQKNPDSMQNRRVSSNRNPFISKKTDDDSGETYVTITCLFALFLRLRQACVHMHLTKKAIDLEAFKEDGGSESDVLAELEAVMEKLSLVYENNDMKNANGTTIRVDDIFEKKYVSAKLRVLLERVDDALNAGDKCVIVSQWTTLLEIIEWHLLLRNVDYTSITGAILTKDRQARVDSFNRRDGGAQVMLLSLTAGGVGLNLIGGNHLFLVDLHWNPALEAQACDRIYRMGQTKNVFIHKLICQETIEQRVLQLQEKKLALANGVLDGAASKNKNPTIEDIKYLFGFVSNFSSPKRK